ncbi:MAG: hypothetical protein RMK29_21985, partial [Myxococcales bacterium]|nr:hypothetical protein [Myxococcales bacterium]
MHAAQPLLDLLSPLCQLATHLPQQPLQPSARMALGGVLFPGYPLFVRTVARALAAAPELFPDVPVSPQQLLDRQDRAQAAQLLARALEALAARARDLELAEAAAAVSEAMRVLRQVRADRARPYGHPLQLRRALQLVDAEAILAAHKPRRPARARPARRLRPRAEAAAEAVLGSIP